jgi:transcriptional regulator with AAA-type ATPase domain
MARLRFKRGNELVLQYNLRPGRTLIGRSDACDLVVPEKSLSRTHCIVESRGDAWVVRDRSRHGTFVDGRRIEQTWVLEEGQCIELGPYRLEFTRASIERVGTASVAHSAIPPVDLVQAGDSFAIQRVVLVVDEGPAMGRRAPLSKLRTPIGGAGSTGVELRDPSLLPDHLTVRLVRGRPMVLPGQGATVVDGSRVDGPMPLYMHEPVRAGDTVFHVEPQVVEQSPEASSFGEMVGTSVTSRRLFGVLKRMAVHNAPVLLLGESGTGKELAARGLHDHGPNADGPFVAVNCGAITATLFESELFGHEKGSFTGATKQRDGAFHGAHNGTLFLDEVGELPESAQVKLLRVLESGEVRRVGGHTVSYPKVRLVAATNRDLQAEVARGGFRGDLFFRLAVLAVRLPPLRERPDDMGPIAQALCKRIAPDAVLTDDGLARLSEHPFPGNIRELRNILTRAYVLGGPRISQHTIQFNPWSFGSPTPRSAAQASDTNEVALLTEAMARHDQNRSAVARELGIARSTLLYKLKKYELI